MRATGGQEFDTVILQDWWYTTLLGTGRPMTPPLTRDIVVDVAVVGAGMAGLSAALRLVGRGFTVALLERNICGGSSTGKSAGFLTPDSELELSQLIRRSVPRELTICGAFRRGEST